MPNFEPTAIVTFSGAVFFGVLFVVIAHRLNISAIAILLLGGIAVGPEVLGIVHPSTLGDSGLKTIVGLAVALILFEGGLTLDLKGYRQVSSEIKSILSIGVMTTWAMTATAIMLIVRDPVTGNSFPISFCILAASLVIVTGPTVIQPLLKRIRIKKTLQNILHWESVLIDPIGVFIALLCYEWLASPGDNPLLAFVQRILIGLLLGGLGGSIIALAIKWEWVPTSNLNIFVVSSALGLFAVSDLMVHESGLLTVTVAGIVIGTLEKKHIAKVKVFKAELIDLLIGMLFVLLAANLELQNFIEYGLPGLGVVLIVMFAVRPLNVSLSLLKSSIGVRERLFLSWVAPRGIVAASMASLFALNLAGSKVYGPYAPFLETFTYSVIAGTVIFQGFTAGFVAKVLGVREPKATGWLIVGAHRLGRIVAAFLKKNGHPVVLIDTNVRNIARSRRENFATIDENVLTVDPGNHPSLYGIGNVLAITENDHLNTLICARWHKELPSAKVYRWSAQDGDEKSTEDGEILAGERVWSTLTRSHIGSLELDDDAITFRESPVAGGKFADDERNLLFVADGLATPDLSATGDRDGIVLRFTPSSSSERPALQPATVVHSNATSIEDIVSELLKELAVQLPGLGTAALAQRLRERQVELTNVIGYGVALCHTYTDGLSHSVIAAAKTVQPVQYAGESVEILILVLSPANEPQGHLNTLADISRFIMNDSLRKLLLDANDQDSLEQVFKAK
jgi:NhaP-type Na+/H+ or K+/H+ antiporter/mannitol/fructose-specific phosphotransferase system IIA component (Ntr-type)